MPIHPSTVRWLARVASWCLIYLATPGGTVASTAHAEPIVEESTVFFDIGLRVTTPREIEEGIRRHSPLVTDGVHAIGVTYSNASWSYKVAQRGNDCRLASSEVRLKIVIKLPMWAWYPNSDNNGARFWECVEATVTAHEHRHAAISRETAREIDAALGSFRETVPCDRIRDRVNEIANGIWAAGMRRQQAFDAQEQRRPRYETCRRQVSMDGVRAAPSRTQIPGLRGSATTPPEKRSAAPPAAPAPLPAARPVDLAIDKDHLVSMAGFLVLIAVLAGFVWLAMARLRQLSRAEDMALTSALPRSTGGAEPLSRDGGPGFGRR